MKDHNPNNERIKRKHLVFLKKETKRQSELSIDAAVHAISRFENYTKCRDFKAFHFEQAIGFKKYLARQNGCRTQEGVVPAKFSGGYGEQALLRRKKIVLGKIIGCL